MSSITENGLALLSRINEGAFIFTRASFDIAHFLAISGEVKEGNIHKLKLRTDNLNLETGVKFNKILVYAKIGGDTNDVVYAEILKADYIPSKTEMPQYVADFELCFTFDTIENIAVTIDSHVYALQTDVNKKINLYTGKIKPPDDNLPYIWLEEISDNTVLNLTSNQSPLGISIDGQSLWVENSVKNSNDPLKFTIK